MVLIGGIIVFLTLVAIAKRYETRMVLCASGFLMAVLVEILWEQWMPLPKL